jgi:hypothetical protein
MIDFVKPDPTVIRKVVHYSVLLRNIRLTLLQLRRTMLMIRGLNTTIPNFEDLREVEAQLMRRADEIQSACKLMLQPLLDGKDFGHTRLNHWSLSMGDIKCGFCELEEILAYNDDRPIQFGRKYILLLNDYTDSTLGKFYAGELIPLEKAIHFIDSIPIKENRITGLYDAVIRSLEMAMRYRQSNSIK